jgi:hypothetical protein
MMALLPLLISLPLEAQDAAAQKKKFAGTWEAKWKDKVICTLRLKAGEQITGETEACNINVDANGDLQEPQSTDSDTPSPILNAKLEGDTLTFEEKDGDDVLKFKMKLVEDGRAELTILDAPVAIKPIRFDRK